MPDDAVDSLILDLLEFVGHAARPYDEVMEAWRTSCPRLPVWEDANERGFLLRTHVPGRGELIALSPAGANHLRHHRVIATA
jgi:D-3-phosphoglycerate dehydrogenase